MTEYAQIAFDPGSQAPMEQLPTEFPLAPEQQVPVEQQQSMELFGSSLDSLAVDIPELEENREAVATAGAELIEAFGIKPELFESPYRSLIFASISSRLSKLDTENPAPADRQEREFIADATLLLSKNFTDEYADIRASLEAENNPNHLSDKGFLEIYDKYTDEEHSEAVTKAIADGLLDDVKQAMGITEENEAPFRVRVLSVATSSTETFGLHLGSRDFPENWEDLSMKERSAFYRDSSADLRAGHDWEEGLDQRSEDFRKATGSKSAAPAWVTTIGGETQLCISLPLAEKLLYKDEVTKNVTYYGEDEYQRDLATLEHEYTHTQQDLIDPELDIDFGVTFAERHAEHFSGNKGGYVDVKHFLQDVALVTGVNSVEIFDEVPQKGRDATELLEVFANNLGVDRVVELLTVMPKNYTEEQNNVVRSALHGYIGGYEGFLQRLYSERVSQGQAAQIQERINERAQFLVDLNYDFWSPEQYQSVRRSWAKTEFLEEELMTAIAAERAKVEAAQAA